MSSPAHEKRAAYEATFQQFLAADAEAIIGSLTAHSFFSVELTQRNAWLTIIDHLKADLVDIEDGYLFLEFTIPRMGRRVDALVLCGGCVFVLEYKIGAEHFHSSDIDQVLGYALDLKNFHEPSHNLPIVPILIATGARPINWCLQPGQDDVYETVLSNGDCVSDLFRSVTRHSETGTLSPTDWANGRYKPTPTIIEAAQALYRNHQVDDITRHEAGAENLSKTAAYVSSVIQRSKTSKQKSICFVTGVPGSGKTLAGLNIASIRTRVAEDEYAVFLSGNGPLVRVLRAALDRDHKDQSRTLGLKIPPRENGARSVEQFIQNIHHFRDANLGTEQAPIEKVVIFDEAQRAWNTQATSQFMKRKRNRPGFAASEPEFLLAVMNRHPDWCTVICLVGNGQEINTGEAGLNEWFTALRERFPGGEIHLSDRILQDPASFGVTALPSIVTTESALHLSTAIRSFRSESVSSFVFCNRRRETQPSSATSGASSQDR